MNRRANVGLWGSKEILVLLPDVELLVVQQTLTYFCDCRFLIPEGIMLAVVDCGSSDEWSGGFE
jgi:hypothetical protein